MGHDGADRAENCFPPDESTPGGARTPERPAQPGLDHAGSRTDWRAELSRQLLRDVLGAVIAVNGVTITVVCDDLRQAARLVDLVPEGIDFTVPPRDGGHATALTWALADHLARDFARIVAVAGDVVGLNARGASTALSSLADAHLVAGATPDESLYLLGVRDEVGLEAVRACSFGRGLTGAGSACLRQEAARRQATVRWLESQGRLGEFVSTADLAPSLFEPESTPRSLAYVERALAGRP